MICNNQSTQCCFWRRLSSRTFLLPSSSQIFRSFYPCGRESQFRTTGATTLQQSMDLNTRLEDVISVLQGILSAPRLPNSSDLASQRVLPEKIPKLNAARIQEARLLSSHQDYS